MSLLLKLAAVQILKSVAPVQITNKDDANQPQFTKIEVRKILEANQYFDEKIFNTLLIRDDLDHLLYSNANNLIHSIAIDFPEVVKI